MTIQLKSTDTKHKFILLIEALNPVLRLKRREKEVLLYFLIEYKELTTYNQMTEQLLADTLISTTTRQKVREQVKMSEPSFNNHIHQLKNKGVMVDGKLLSTLTNMISTNDLKVEYLIEENG
jgi:hypothetical protein